MSPNFEDVSTDVAWRLCAYESYGGNRSRAVAAFRRRVSGTAGDGCEAALDAAIALFDACKATMAEHAASYIHVRGDCDFSPLHKSLKPQLAAFTEKHVDGMLGMVLYYFHLR